MIIIVFAALAALSAGGMALAESRDRPRRREIRMVEQAQAAA